MKLSDLTNPTGTMSLTEPLKAQSATSLAKMLYLAPLLPIAYGLYLSGADRLLSPENAADVKDMIRSMAQALGTTVVTVVPTLIGGRSLLTTYLKGKAQMPSVPDTVNAAGDVNVQTGGSTPVQGTPFEKPFDAFDSEIAALDINNRGTVDWQDIDETEEPLPIREVTQ